MVYSTSPANGERGRERDRKRGACAHAARLCRTLVAEEWRDRAEREGEMERGRASESDKKGARNENDGKRERERERVYARIYKVVSRAGMTIRGAGWVNR